MKTIRFNLLYADRQIKTLDELRKYGNIDMLLETTKNGLLERWLESQGQKDLARQVREIQNIPQENIREICNQLCLLIFENESSTAQQIAAEIFAIRERERQRLKNFESLAKNEKKIIEVYHRGYDNILEKIRENVNDMVSLIVSMTEIDSNYRELFNLDKKRFYDEFKVYPHVLLALMANQSLRDFIDYNRQVIFDQIFNSTFNNSDDSDTPTEKRTFREKIDARLQMVTEMIKRGEGERTPAVYLKTENQLLEFIRKNTGKYFGNIFQQFGVAGDWCYRYSPVSTSYRVGEYYISKNDLLSENFTTKDPDFLSPLIKIFSGETDSYWKDLEPKEKKCMIISMKPGNKLRNAGKRGEELTDSDINGKFIFTDGIDYMSNSASDRLVYMYVED